MKAVPFVEAAAVGALVLALQAGILFLGVARPLGAALRGVEVAERLRADRASISPFGESIEVLGARPARG